jgi:hypothetical protein
LPFHFHGEYKWKNPDIGINGSASFCFIECVHGVFEGIEIVFLDDGFFVGDLPTAGFVGEYSLNGDSKALRLGVAESRPIEVSLDWVACVIGD